MVADAGTLGELAPTATLPTIQSKALDSLAQRQIFTKADHIKGNWLWKLQDQFRGGDIVVGAPVPAGFGAKQIFRGEQSGLAADIAGLELRAFGEVVREGCLNDPMKLLQ